jgi:hypothetical protein
MNPKKVIGHAIQRGRGLVVGASILVGLTGCASHSVEVAASQPSTSARLSATSSPTPPSIAVADSAAAATPPDTIAAQTSDLHMGGTDRVTLAPPPVGVAPAISFTAAIAIASAHDQYPDQFATGSETVSYGDFTDLDARHDNGDGTYGPPTYDHVLAVDVRFAGILVPSHGGPAASEVQTPQPLVPNKADVNIILNATSGQLIFTFEDGVS